MGGDTGSPADEMGDPPASSRSLSSWSLPEQMVDGEAVLAPVVGENLKVGSDGDAPRFNNRCDTRVFLRGTDGL